MNLTYVRGVTSDWVLKKSKRMKEFIKSTVLGWGQFDIEVLDTKTGRQFKLPTITGIFFNNKIDKETFCYTPVQSGSSQEGDRIDDCGYNVVFNIVTFLNEKDKNPEEESLTSFGNSFDCGDINQIEKALLDERYANLLRGIDNAKRFDYMNDGIRSELSGDFSLTQLFEPYRWQPVKAFMTYYPSDLNLPLERR